MIRARSALLMIAVGVAALAVISRHATDNEAVRPVDKPSAVRPDPIRKIATRANWDSATKNRCCVLFVDCPWNIEVVRFRRPFASFADWCQANTKVSVLTMKLDSEDVTNDVWQICDQLWAENDIDQGGLKNSGGAGRVVWINNGRVVDYAWCMELTNADNIEDTESLRTRTRKAFGR
jgi:hypothetical protein